MKSILKSTAILSSGSLVTILVGLAAAKGWAILLGPSGLGFMGLLQSLVGLTSLIAGMGVGTGVVRMGASALERNDSLEVASLHRAAWLLLIVLGSIATLLMALFRTPISTAMLGGPEHGDLVLLMALATFSSMAAGVATGMLNAHHRVSALARLAILNSVLGAGISLALVWALRERGIALAIIAGTFVHFLIAYLLLSRNVTVDSSVQAALQDVLRSAKSLLQFGGPYTASMLVGTGVQLALPALIVHSLGTEGVGFYRAAVAVSINYLSFLLVSMGQDYYPRISAASNRPAELVHLVNQQHRLVMLLGAPMILGTLAMAPYLVPLIYSAEFTPTIELLEWQLIGDLFKFASWTMGYILLARNRTLSFFCAELSFGAAILATSWLSMQWFGLAGLGMAFVITYAVLYLINFLLVRHEIKFVLTLANQRILLSALAAALIVRALPFLGLEHWRTPLALTIALIAGLVSVTVIWREFARDAVKERIVVAD